MGLGNPDLERRIKAGETLSREEALEIWDDVRCGIRKQFPHNSHNSTSFLADPKHREYIGEAFVLGFRFNELIAEFNNWQCPRQTDFADAKLDGMLNIYYESSPYALFVYIGMINPKNPNYDAVFDKTPWLAVEKLPNSYWDNEENRINATKWLVKTLRHMGKKVEDIVSNDFKLNFLHELVDRSGSAYAALVEAGYDVDPTQMHQVPKAYWGKQNRIKFTTARAKEIGRLPGRADLPEWMLAKAGGVNAALKEAGLLISEAKSE